MGRTATAVLAGVAGVLALLVLGGPGAAVAFGARFAATSIPLALPVYAAYAVGSVVLAALPRMPRPRGVLNVLILGAMPVAMIAHGAAMLAASAGWRGAGPETTPAERAALAATYALALAGGAIGAFRRDEA